MGRVSGVPERMPDDPFNEYQFLYFDRARTHKLWTSVERRRGALSFLYRESPYGSDDPADRVTHEQRIAVPWAARLALHDLESKLTSSGVPYYRLHAPTRRVDALPTAEMPLDLTPHALPMPGGGREMFLHHFHNRQGRSNLQFTLPRADLPGEHYMLANFRFDALEPGEGELDVVHPRLSRATLRHQWVSTHVDLPRSGFRKLAKAVDYAVAFGENWSEKWQKAVRGALQLLYRAGDGDASATGPDPVPPMTEAGITLEDALQSDVVKRVRARHLSPQEFEDLLARGELTIRRFIRARRKGARHDEQTHLSLLEATLLTAYGARAGREDLVRHEGPRVVRLVADFTGLLQSGRAANMA